MARFLSQMKTSFLGLFIILILISCSGVKKGSGNLLEQKALLWEIMVPGAKNPSYVFGTIHIIPAEDFFYPAGTLAAFDKVDKVFFEIDMSQMNDMSTLMGMMDKLYMKDNKTLKDLLTNEEYSKVNTFFKSKGLPLIFLERMKPMFLTVLTYGDASPSALQEGKMKSYEFSFLELANQLHYPTGGLETMDFQISVFDKIPYEVQAKMLVESIDQSSVEDGEFRKMVDLYKTQDIQKLVNSISEEGNGISDYEDILVNERNKNWIPIIIHEAQTQPSFFAVGAGHLGGKNGVLNLLREKGVNIRPITK